MQKMIRGIIALFIWSSTGAQELPEGEGRNVVAAICSQCHQLRLITDRMRTREQWQYVVSTMIALGAPVPGEDVTVILDYLVKNFGRSPEPVPDEP